MFFTDPLPGVDFLLLDSGVSVETVFSEQSFVSLVSLTLFSSFSSFSFSTIIISSSSVFDTLKEFSLVLILACLTFRTSGDVTDFRFLLVTDASLLNV